MFESKVRKGQGHQCNSTRQTLKTVYNCLLVIPKYICRMIPILHLIALIFQIMSGAKSQKLEQQKPTNRSM